MEIRVFGMTLRLEVLIITLLLGMVLGGHLLCSCAKVPISEAFGQLTEGAESGPVAAGAVAPVAGDGAGTDKVPAPATAQTIPVALADKKKNDTTEKFSDYSEYRAEDSNADVTGSWISKAGKYSSDLGYQSTSGKANTYVGTAVPLPDGELFFFQNNQFKPECCPAPYSSSTGCACMSAEQIKYLNTRGGNRTSDSEF
jgi:hypothetical protein